MQIATVRHRQCCHIQCAKPPRFLKVCLRLNRTLIYLSQGNFFVYSFSSVIMKNALKAGLKAAYETCVYVFQLQVNNYIKLRA